MDLLSNTVIKNGFCIGCGVCTATKGSPFKMELDKFGMYGAKKKRNIKSHHKSHEVCPFYSDLNEDKLTKISLNLSKLRNNEYLGYFSNIYAGHVKNENYRLSSSSGGLVSWTLEQLISNNLVDAVIHVKQSVKKPILFEYAISESVNEIRKGKKSRYYPIELSQVLKEIKGKDKRYAVVGLPCFIKALRLLVLKEKGYANLLYFIGIVCGQLKSAFFSNLFAEQYKVSPSKLEGIDFRVKVPNTNASEYVVGLNYHKGEKIISSKTKTAKHLFGSDWGMGMFKYQACDVCDDVYNETADIVFGDAWVEPYQQDWKGTNLIIIRNPIFTDIFEKARTNKEIILNDLNEDDAIHTQLSSIRHRRETIGYRLYHFHKILDWVPSKRFKPSNEFNKEIRTIQNLRLKISKKSHSAMQLSIKYNSFFIFKALMKPYVIAYNYQRWGPRIFIPSLIKKMGRKILNSLK